MIWFQYNWATLIIINLSVFSVCLSCCVSQKKSALGASTMRGPCVSLLSAAHRGRPPLTPWYTGTQQLGPLGGAGRWHQQRRLFQLYIMHTRCFSCCPGGLSAPKKRACPVEWKGQHQIVQQFLFVQADFLMNILTLRSFPSLSILMPLTDNRVWQTKIWKAHFFVFQTTFHRKKKKKSGNRNEKVGIETQAGELEHSQ